MKALVYTGPQALEFQDADEPVPGNDEVLVRVDSCGICGSDMHAWLGHDDRRPAPLILGHEAAGTIVGGGRDGDRVTINPLVTCGRCDACLDGRPNLCAERQIISMPPREGAFAQAVKVPERNVVSVPEGMSFALAALTEPVATSWHAVNMGERALVRPLSEARVVVIGGGAIGMAAALILRARGPAQIRVAETNALRRSVLDRQGGFEAYDPLDADAEGDGPQDGSADLVVDAVGSPATRALSTRLAAPGSVIVHIGLQESGPGLDTRRMTLQEITFIGTYTYTMVDFRRTLDALASGVLGDLDWIEQRPLADGAVAFDDLHAGRTPAAKIILRP